MAPEYYKFDVSQLPDELYQPEAPVSKWLETVKTANKEGFPPNSLNILHPIPWDVNLERTLGVALYMLYNVLPFGLPLLLLLALAFSLFKHVLVFVLVYWFVIWSTLKFFFDPYFVRKYNCKGKNFTDLLSKSTRENQYIYTERNLTKYFSLNVVWPQSMHRPAMEKTPVIFCLVPHGVIPMGITAYPLFSKLWNDKLCHWTSVPIIFKLPWVGFFLKQMGYIPALQKDILETLTKKEENVGLILDGIEGMFHQSHKEEILYLQKRKGIVKIALKAGVPLVPVYGFGHTALWTVIVDPFSLLEKLSIQVQASLTPFFGRFGWFLGPPRRIPVSVCLGEPVRCPQVPEPTQEQVDEYHRQFLDSYRQLFETHKNAYGWGHKKLRFV